VCVLVKGDPVGIRCLVLQGIASDLDESGGGEIAEAQGARPDAAPTAP
jgi:hypothetical protein